MPAAVRKRKQHQQKLLRPQLILASHKDGIKPLHVPTKHKARGPAKPLPGSVPGGAAALAAAEAAAAAAAATAQGKRKPQRRRGKQHYASAPSTQALLQQLQERKPTLTQTSCFTPASSTSSCLSLHVAVRYDALSKSLSIYH